MKIGARLLNQEYVIVCANHFIWNYQQFLTVSFVENIKASIKHNLCNIRSSLQKSITLFDVILQGMDHYISGELNDTCGRSILQVLGISDKIQI